MSRQASRSFLLMLFSVLLAGVLLPWLANAYWIKTLTSALSLSIAVAGVALLLTLAAVLRAQKPLGNKRFPELKAQIDSDAKALRMAA